VAKTGAGVGARTSGIFGLLVGAVFIWVSVVGPLLVAGSLATALVGGVEGAAAGGGLGGLLGALTGRGVSKQHPSFAEISSSSQMPSQWMVDCYISQCMLM
jgi:uncharacterized membrane protein